MLRLGAANEHNNCSTSNVRICYTLNEVLFARQISLFFDIIINSLTRKNNFVLLYVLIFLEF